MVNYMQLINELIGELIFTFKYSIIIEGQTLKVVNSKNSADFISIPVNDTVPLKDVYEFLEGFVVEKK